MSNYVVKIKSKTGLFFLKTLSENSSIESLKSAVADLIHLNVEQIHILVGYPPKVLDVFVNSTKTLKESGIQNGDVLIVEEKEENSTIETLKIGAPVDKQFVNEFNNVHNEFDGILLKAVVPADNSCLFTSVGYVLNGQIDTHCHQFMRQVIAEQVSLDKETYTEAFLGKSNEDYCAWIRNADTWGGAIEVSILSRFYGVEMAVVDITNAIINRFGEDHNYGLRVFLLYDGIHYDPLFLEPFNGGEKKTIFPIEVQSVFLQAQQLADEAKSARQYTDVNKFTIKCIECKILLIGQSEVRKHAKVTGHANFGEI